MCDSCWTKGQQHTNGYLKTQTCSMHCLKEDFIKHKYAYSLSYWGTDLKCIWAGAGVRQQLTSYKHWKQDETTTLVK